MVAPAPESASEAEAGAEAPILECKGLSRSFDGVEVVGDVSIAFQRARLSGIIGPNGAGKSTVLAMLAGTLPASSGRILVRWRRCQLLLLRVLMRAGRFAHLPRRKDSSG